MYKLFQRMLDRFTAEPYYLETEMNTIKEVDGKFVLIGKGSQIVGSYARRRDAIRGATRRGLNLA